ncbi:MAG: HAMP domain-containing protein [Acidobacteriota bacterium]|nr:HAMP domain-containing protein [Acidobacteriota bacterium]
MRLTVTKKIVLGISIIVLIAMVSMFIVYDGLSTLQKNVHELAVIEEPTAAAAYEMEINVLGLGMGVLKYLDSHNPRDRQQVQKDQSDFERFHAEYVRLAKTPRHRELADRAEALYKDFKALGETMMANKDDEEAIFAVVGQNFERMDNILDRRIQANINRQRSGGSRKVEQSLDLEADIAEIGIWLATYQRTHKAEHKELIWTNEREFRETLRRFKNNPQLSVKERQSTGDLENIFNETIAGVQGILTIEERMQEDRRRFTELQTQIDDLLDEEIQSLALRDLSVPAQEADREMVSVVSRARILMPLFFLSAIAVAFFLIRSVIEPVRQLMRGTEAISRGDLHYRIVPTGRDELAELAEQFNQMVIQLKATTVSKALLEASAGKLQETVGDLRREIAERERAEGQLRNSREQLRALSAHLQSVREEERTRLAREIHDELGQLLTGMIIDLSWLEEKLSAANGATPSPSLVAKVRSLLQLADTTVDTVRRIATELRTGLLDDFGLMAAVEWQTQEFQSRTGIKCDLVINLDGTDLDSTYSAAVFRIFQEALTNVARHAEASSVSIVLEKNEGQLILQVEDNGKGVTEEVLANTLSLGVVGMRERALILGGEVEIRGVRGKGTRVTARIPHPNPTASGTRG